MSEEVLREEDDELRREETKDEARSDPPWRLEFERGEKTHRLPEVSVNLSSKNVEVVGGGTGGGREEEEGEIVSFEFGEDASNEKEKRQELT